MSASPFSRGRRETGRHGEVFHRASILKLLSHRGIGMHRGDVGILLERFEYSSRARRRAFQHDGISVGLHGCEMSVVGKRLCD